MGSRSRFRPRLAVLNPVGTVEAMRQRQPRHFHRLVGIADVQHDHRPRARTLRADRGLELAVREVLDAQVDRGRDLPAGARRLEALDLVELLDAALHLRGLGGVRGEALDEALFLGQHRLLPRERRLLIRLPNRPLALIKIVIPRINRNFSSVDFRDLRHNALSR